MRRTNALHSRSPGIFLRWHSQDLYFHLSSQKMFASFFLVWVTSDPQKRRWKVLPILNVSVAFPRWHYPSEDSCLESHCLFLVEVQELL